MWVVYMNTLAGTGVTDYIPSGPACVPYLGFDRIIRPVGCNNTM
jgi:hypothetical protein